MIRYDGEDLGSGMRLKYEAPILEIGDDYTKYPNGENLPSVWITKPVYNSNNEYLGRTYVQVYIGSDDPSGTDALFYGIEYYEEGMTFTAPEDKCNRQECFQAAELLYRHAAASGIVRASMCLGYVYSYDRCDGWYFGYFEDDTREAREKRAHDCFKVAAQANIAEACYKLGDMYKHGMGCDANAKEAFEWYVKAAHICKEYDETPTVLGSAALRLAGCYEEGFGCTQSFSNALAWYEQAVSGLDVAVRNGDAWYSRALNGAKDGMKRCKQEIEFS